MRQRKNNTWDDSITINGKRYFFYGKTKKAVQAKRDEFLRSYRESSDVKFKTIAEAWWDNAEPQLAYNTTISYKPALKRAEDMFGERSADSITPPEIAAYIKKFSKDHADKTCRTQLMIINLIFAYAVETGAVKLNPARDLSVPNGLKKKKVTSPSADDIKRVKESTGCTFGMFAYWAMYTGMRKGELLALRWENVDIKSRTINITQSVYQVNNTPHLKTPKTETSIGKIPILDKLAEKIKPQNEGYVFPNEKGELLTNMQFQKLWKSYCCESGVTATPHQFRHCFATMLFEAGVKPEEMQVLLRHAQLSTTMDVYTDIRDGKRDSIFKNVRNVDISS